MLFLKKVAEEVEKLTVDDTVEKCTPPPFWPPTPAATVAALSVPALLLVRPRAGEAVGVNAAVDATIVTLTLDALLNGIDVGDTAGRQALPLPELLLGPVCCSLFALMSDVRKKPSKLDVVTCGRGGNKKSNARKHCDDAQHNMMTGQRASASRFSTRGRYQDALY